MQQSKSHASNEIPKRASIYLSTALLVLEVRRLLQIQEPIFHRVELGKVANDFHRQRHQNRLAADFLSVCRLDALVQSGHFRNEFCQVCVEFLVTSDFAQTMRLTFFHILFVFGKFPNRRGLRVVVGYAQQKGIQTHYKTEKKQWKTGSCFSSVFWSFSFL